MVIIIFVCLFINALLCSLFIFKLSGGLVRIGMMPLIGQLNSSIAGLGSPDLVGLI